MQKKSSYRFLKWTLLACATASLASACVVTTGDGGDDFFDGGEGGTNSTAGTNSTEGGSAGTKADASGSAGTTATTGGGGSETTGSAGAGGEAPTEMVGLCDADAATSATLPSCAPDDKDSADACRKCMRASCCDQWKTCFGSDPHNACGWGNSPSDDYEGQFDCVRNCYQAAIDAGGDPNDDNVIADCSFQCTKQCDDVDMGFPTQATQDLIECSKKSCNDDCFPPN